MSRTLIGEIIGGLVALIIAGLVGGLWTQVGENTKVGLHNKDAIIAGKAAGDAEIKRSTAIDNQGAIDIEKNFKKLDKLEDFMHSIDKEVGSLSTAVKYMHNDGDVPMHEVSHKKEIE